MKKPVMSHCVIPIDTFNKAIAEIKGNGNINDLPIAKQMLIIAYEVLRSYPQIDLKRHNEYIDTVMTSCDEGMDGTWDCSTEEGKDGFDDMKTLLAECII